MVLGRKLLEGIGVVVGFWEVGSGIRGIGLLWSEGSIGSEVISGLLRVCLDFWELS